MNDINPIKPVIETPFLTQNQIISFWVFISVIFFVLGVLLIFYLYKRYFPQKTASKTCSKGEVVPIDHRRLARNKLKSTKKYINSAEYKKFYLKSSAIMKTYWSAVYKKNYIDLTSREILGDKTLPTEAKSKISKFLHSSDLAKFASQDQEKKKAEEIYELALLILK